MPMTWRGGSTRPQGVWRRLWLIVGIVQAGCGGLVDDPGGVIVATSWPASERARIEEAYRRQVEALPGNRTVSGRIHWVVLDASDDPTRLALRGRPPDVLLGGLMESHRRLGASEVVEVRVARRARLGMAVASRPLVSRDDRPTFDDPRRDPLAFAWSRVVLRSGDWDEGYATLVRAAGGPRRIGMNPGGALAAVERGEAERSPAPEPFDGQEVPGRTFEAEDGWPVLVEGVSALTGGRHPLAARAFLSIFEEGSDPTDPEPDDLGLLADFLGATLVESQDELWGAWRALEVAGHPPRAERWMTEPPPWPPASVSRMLQRESNAMAMVETLAGQVAPEADARAWLIRSWLSPPRRVDGAFLGELATAVEGRLAREPRFRSWLRAEWTAWARQRYRRVARNAEAPRG
ncbi:MAG: hypothetical protein AB7I30_04250 [Isosphaeraceae bacterium]